MLSWRWLQTALSATGEFVFHYTPFKSMQTIRILTVRALALFAAIVGSFIGSDSRAANIVWVSDTPNNGALPGWSGPIAGTPDDGWVTLLQNAGHNVVRYTSDDNTANLLSAGDITALNTNDLIILGRAMGSGAFQGAQGVQWNTAITKPMIVQSSFLVRASRLGYFAAESSLNGAPTPLLLVSPNDPESGYLVGGVPLNGSITANNYDEALEQNTSQTIDAPVAGGTILAKANTTNNAIVDFPAGTAVRGGNLAGYRLYFASGNREASSLTTAGAENLTSSGENIFLRAVTLALNLGIAPNLGQAPAITSQPVSTNGCSGLTVSLSVAATGQDPLYYQWFLGAAPVTGGTNATLTINNLQAANEGSYTVVVSNAVSTITSDAATVTITGVGTTASAVASQTNCPGTTVNFSTTAAGSGTLSYTWRKGGTIVQGPDGNNSFSIASVAPADAGQYSVSVSGDCNTISNSFTLVVAPAPIITLQPQSQTVPMGNGVVFSVTALTTNAGAAPLSYVWQTNGVEVAGATGSSISISNLTLADSGLTASVVVSNCAGSVASSVATLTVTPISGISFDFNTAGQYTNAPYNMFNIDWNYASNTLVGFASHFGPVVPFEVSTGGVGVATGSGALDLAFNAGNVHCSILHPISYDFSLPNQTLVASVMLKLKFPLNNNRNTQIGFTTLANGDLDNAVGRSYMSMILQSLAQPAPNFELRTGNKPNGVNTFQEGNNTGSLGLTTNRWYKLTATFVNNSAVQAGTYLMSGTLEDFGTNGLDTPITTITRSAVTITNVDLVASKQLYFVVRGIENTGVDYLDNYAVYTTNGPVHFVQEPSSQTIQQGRTASFRVLVNGQGPYTYQWFKNGNPIEGAGNWRYSTPQVTTSDNGAQYHVTVTSPNNTISSTPVTLTVQSDDLDVLSAGSVDGSLVGVRFDQPVTVASAENIANYSINGVAPLSAKLRVINPLNPMQQLRTNQTEVLLIPATPVSGSFNVTVGGVTSLSGNAVGVNNTAVGQVIGLTSIDIDPQSIDYRALFANPSFQIGTLPGSTYSFAPGQIELNSGGHDIFGNFDGFRFAYQEVTGDFDVKVHVPYLDPMRTPAKAGFNARVSLDPASPNVGAYANPGGPGRNIVEGGQRQLYNSGSASWGNNAATVYPNVWVRFRRVANTFTRYSSTDGVNWQCDGVFSPNPAFPETLFVGIAGNCNSGANNIQSLVTSQYDSLGSGPQYPGAVITITGQPQPITVNAGTSVNLGVTNTVVGGGIPSAAGEVFYIWQRTNSVAGGWTNMPTAGSTNNLVATGPLFRVDNGTHYRVIITAAGALSVTSSVVAVTVNDTAAPTVATVFAPTNSAGTFIVRFNEDVSESTALNVSNYRLTNLTTLVVYNVTGASFLGTDRRTVVLTTSEALTTAIRYALGISGVQDLAGNNIAVTTPTFPVAGANGRNAVVINYYGSLATAANLGDLTGNIKFINNAPDWTVYSNSFQVNGGATGFPTSGIGDNYGVKMFAYFIAPSNSQYVFWWRADDFAQFSMTTNPATAGGTTNPVGKTSSAILTANNPNYVAANTFITPPLTAGQAYYTELLFKEGGGGDGGVVMVTMGNSTATAPAATSVAPSYLWAFPDALAPAPKMISELYTGLANIGQTGIAGNGQLPDLYYVTNFQSIIVGNPSISAYQKYSAYSTNLGNTSQDNYYGRLYGYFVPPTNGNYRFYTRSDDASALYMNTNAVGSTDPTGKTLLRAQFAYTNGTTLWQAPVAASLVGGQMYYLEALWREGGGGDGVSIAVRGGAEPAPTSFLELIPDSMLVFPTNLDRFGPINFNQAGAPGGVFPVNPTVTDGQSITFQARGVSGGLPYLGFAWSKNGVQQMANSAFWVTPPLTLADNGAVITLTVSNLFSQCTVTSILSVLPDNTAPTIVSAVASQYGDTVLVTFDEDVESFSAETAGNYSIAGLTIYSASRDDVSGNRVSLQTSQQTPGVTYTLVVNGVKDNSTGGNPTFAATKNFTAWGFGGLGSAFVEMFLNIQNTTVDAFLTDPKGVYNMPDIAYYTNVFAVGQFAAHSGRENWAARITGLFMPPTNGLYQFYVRGDDGTRLYMNTNGPAASGRVQVARNDGANSATVGADSGYITGVGLGRVGQSVTPVMSLTNGTPYYMEAIMKEGGGGDYMVVVMRAIDPLTLLPIGGLPLTPAASDSLSGGFFQTTGNPDINQLLIVSAPPTELTVFENEQVNLQLIANAIPASLTPYISYQWQRTNDGSGTFTNIPGATTASLSFYANLTDDESHYRLRASIPGQTIFVQTLLHVETDVTPPYLVSASARERINGVQLVGIAYDGPVDSGIATEPSGYYATDEFGTTVNFTTAQYRSGYPNKLLLTTTEGPLIGNFTVFIDFIKDTASTPNEGFGLSATGAVQRLTEQVVGTVGSIAIGGYNTAAPGLGFIGLVTPTESFTDTNAGWDVSANGWDIWNTADGFLFNHREVSGNFDIKTRIQKFTGADQWSKAGLMVRPSTNSNSRMFFMCATPATTPIAGQAANNLFAAQYRDLDGGAPVNVQNSIPPSYPNAWVRLQRSNSVFYGYWSTNGTDWTLLAQRDFGQTVVGGFPDTVLVGLGTTSHDQTRSLNNNAYAEYRDLYFPAGAVITQQPEPAFTEIGIHQSVTFSNVVATGAGVKYQWRLNGVAIPDATNTSLTLPDTAVSQSGIYTVVAFTDGGGQVSSGLVLVVTNTLPTVVTDNLVSTQGIAITVTGASLLANDSDLELDSLSLLAVSGVYPASFSSDFNSGLPAGTAIFGNAIVDAAGGVSNSGALVLHPALGSQAGGFIVGNLTPNRRVTTFSASFRLRIAEGSAEPADGFSFNFAPDLPDAAAGGAENGVGTGLSFCVDNYRFAPYPAGGTANTSGMKLRYNNVDLLGVQMPGAWNVDRYVPVTVTVTVDGVATVTVDGTNVFGNVVLPGYAPKVGRFGFFSRTGGALESTKVDDLSIVSVHTIDTTREQSFAAINGNLYGNAYMGSNFLHLTDAANSQVGSYVLNNLTPGSAVNSFNASFKLRIGNGTADAADGFSFNFANDLPDAATGLTAAEEGIGTGLSLSVDNYPAVGAPDSPSLKLRYGGTLLGFVLIPKWNSPNWVPITVNLDADGTLDVVVDGTNVVANLPTPYVPTVGRFGMYARTGGQNETHWVDDLVINVVSAGGPASFSTDFATSGYGTVVLSGGNVTYTPPATGCGTDTFYYLASDGQLGGISIGTVNVSITETNPLPLLLVQCATNRTISLGTNSQVPVPNLTVEIVTSGSCGALVINQTPLAGTLVGAGDTVVTITATDSRGSNVTCQATVTVLPSEGPTIIPGTMVYNGVGGTASASFATVNGVSYRIIYKNDLNDPTWSLLTTIVGDGTIKTFTDPGPLPSMRYYRIEILP
jgi:hypothetical protein